MSTLPRHWLGSRRWRLSRRWRVRQAKLMDRLARPSQVVAVSWDSQGVVLMGVKVRGRSTQLVGLTSIEASTAIAEMDIEKLGKGIAEQVGAWNLHRAHFVIGIPNSWVDELLLHLPPATDDELDDFVRNELARQLPDLPDGAMLDYVTESGSATDPRDVRVAVVRPEAQRLLRTLREDSDWKLDHIYLRPHSLVALFRHLVGPVATPALLISLMDRQADLAIVYGDDVVFSRTAHLPVGAGHEPSIPVLVAEIRRTLAVAASEDDVAEQVEHAYLFGDALADGTFVAGLADQLTLPVSILNPLRGIAGADDALDRAQQDPDSASGDPTFRGMTAASRFAPLAGMFQERRESTGIDFARRRQRRRLAPQIARLVVITIVLCMFLALGLMRLHDQVQGLRETNEQLAADVQRAEQLLAKVRTRSAVIDAVEAWDAAGIAWLEELRRLSERFPPPDQAIVQRITFAPAAAGGLITLSIRAASPEMVERLERRLRDGAHHVKSQRITNSSAGSPYPCQFEMTILVDRFADVRLPVSPPGGP